MDLLGARDAFRNFDQQAEAMTTGQVLDHHPFTDRVPRGTPSKTFMRRVTQPKKFYVASLLAALLFASCGRSEVRWFHGNGQLMVLETPSGGVGRNGPCVMFNEDGTLLKHDSAEPYKGTGFYNSGLWVRELTPEELAPMLAEAERITREYRERHD